MVGQRRLPGAAQAAFDLNEDSRLAAELDERAGDLSYAELCRYARGRLADEGEAPKLTGGQRRFQRHYAQMQEEIGFRAGQGDLQKADAFLRSRGETPACGELAVEAGGGEGLHLPGLSERFSRVLCLDCSLTYLVIARKLAEELALHNVCFIRADVTSLPLASRSVAFVHSCGVIEHVASPASMVSEGLRVINAGGVYFCLSPNRFPISLEPHFRLPLFGLIPAWLRRVILPRFRGVSSEKGTDLRSLAQLRGYFESAGEPSPPIFFLPPRLDATVRNTPVRRAVRLLLAVPVVGALVNTVLNRALLPIMPYHIALVRRRRECSG